MHGQKCFSEFSPDCVYNSALQASNVIANKRRCFVVVYVSDISLREALEYLVSLAKQKKQERRDHGLIRSLYQSQQHIRTVSLARIRARIDHAMREELHYNTSMQLKAERMCASMSHPLRVHITHNYTCKLAVKLHTDMKLCCVAIVLVGS